MIYFIVNPAAGSGRALKSVPVINSIMAKTGIKYQFIYTNQPRDTEQVEKALSIHKAEKVVCVGGDGTIQEMLPLMVNSGIPMGIIPAGSGNDVSSSIPGFKKNSGSFEESIHFYVKRMLENGMKEVDAVSISIYPKGTLLENLGEAAPASEYFYLNIASCGFDAEVVRKAAPMKRLFGKGSYFISVLALSLTYEQKPAKLVIDGNPREGFYLLNAVCNGSIYGGGFKICPSAKMDDGLITLCSIEKLPRLKVFAFFPLAMAAKHMWFKEVKFLNCEELCLDYSGMRVVNLDGNLLNLEGPLRFKVIKNAVKVII